MPSLFLFAFQLLVDFLGFLWIIVAQFVLPNTEKSLGSSALILGLCNMSCHISMMVVFLLSKEVVAREKPTSKFTVWLFITISLTLVRILINLLYREYSFILYPLLIQLQAHLQEVRRALPHRAAEATSEQEQVQTPEDRIAQHLRSSLCSPQFKPLDANFIIENPHPEQLFSSTSSAAKPEIDCLVPSSSDQSAETRLKETAKKEEAKQHCFICYQDTPNVIIDPCKHCELCKKCMKDLIKKATSTSCPLCKTVPSAHPADRILQSVSAEERNLLSHPRDLFQAALVAAV